METEVNSTHPPKFGVHIPNRLFVGGIAPETNEQELFEFFTQFGAVKDVKIISDRAGVSKGYGFVTYESESDVKKLKNMNFLKFKERRLNIGPAIRKQAPFIKNDSSFVNNSDILQNSPINNVLPTITPQFIYPANMNVPYLIVPIMDYHKSGENIIPNTLYPQYSMFTGQPMLQPYMIPNSNFAVPSPVNNQMPYLSPTSMLSDGLFVNNNIATIGNYTLNNETINTVANSVPTMSSGLQYTNGFAFCSTHANGYTT